MVLENDIAMFDVADEAALAQIISAAGPVLAAGAEDIRRGEVVFGQKDQFGGSGENRPDQQAVLFLWHYGGAFSRYG